MAKKQADPLPQHTVEEIRAACEAPLPAGVTMVLMHKTVTGLQVHEGGVSVLERPDRPWRQLAAVTRVSRSGFIRSRIRLRFADGSKATVRPYKPKFRCLLETGKRDSLNFSSPSSGDARSNDSPLDGLAAIFVILVAIVMFPISLVMLARELFGISARAKQATLLLPQLQAVAQTD
ncbi:hypothetical protein [Kribbella kalugense]|uniref:Uncharacterized protein n=1 Tax=Kribbella kalugense TaxID=2512221 RepID=A0A4R7ZVK2_9ACTN|nr:hypothetical protein [Kribbella kalugense]TDW22103.1 hypothetical protein EV650_0935 [Kribbella kalugense]